MNEDFPSIPPAEPSPPDTDWREALRVRCHAAISRLPAQPADFSAPPAREAPEPPSLYRFYEELAVLRSESRQGNRRTIDAFQRFSDALTALQSDNGKLRELLQKLREEKSGIARNVALALIDIADRLDRLGEAATEPITTKKGWFSSPAPHPRWETQQTAVEILRIHFRRILTEAGIERIPSQGEDFDPIWMKALEIDDLPPGSPGSPMKVAEEILPGYRIGSQCLRPAEVRLTRG